MNNEQSKMSTPCGKTGVYNATCIITGRKDNLRMQAHRNDKGELIGWFFITEDASRQFEGEAINIEITWSVSKKEVRTGFSRIKIDTL